MSKITYLFGAGASFGTPEKRSLPLVTEIPDKLLSFIDFLENNFGSLDSQKVELNDYYDPTKTYSDYKKELISDLKWLIKEAKNHASIDTFAKKLTLQGKKLEIIKLKTLLTVYFSYEQINSPIDSRYDAFFASLLTSLNSLPENITVVSWNYDSQFELSFSEFLENDRLSGVEDHLRIRSKGIASNYESGFGIYKINGTARNFVEGKNSKAEKSILNRKNDNLDDSFLKKAIDLYSEVLKGRLKPALSFAWEAEIFEKSIIDKAARAVMNSTVLVVIGYSFPFFNREIDRKVIGGMQSLRTVYFQSPEAKKLIQRFKAVDSIKQIVPNLIPLEDDLDQFFLPPEL